jgi:hypothetical protein
MSSSPARLAANAANAQHSTGPHSPEGQVRSPKTLEPTASPLPISSSPDEREEFEQLLSDFQTGVKPQGAIQRTLFDELAAAAGISAASAARKSSSALTQHCKSNSKISCIV